MCIFRAFGTYFQIALQACYINFFPSAVNESNFCSHFPIHPSSETVDRTLFAAHFYFFWNLYCSYLLPFVCFGGVFFFLMFCVHLFLLICKSFSYVIYCKHFPQFVISPTRVLSHLTLSTTLWGSCIIPTSVTVEVTEHRLVSFLGSHGW